MYSLPKCGVEQDEMLQAASTIGSAMTDFVSEAIMPHNKQSLGYWCHRALLMEPTQQKSTCTSLACSHPKPCQNFEYSPKPATFCTVYFVWDFRFFSSLFLVVIFVYICVIFYNGWAFVVYLSFEPFYEFCAIYCFIGEITLWYYNYSNCLPTLF